MDLFLVGQDAPRQAWRDSGAKHRAQQQATALMLADQSKCRVNPTGRSP
ncbi:MAG TPA: hypothetical protein VGG12_07415 [Methylovirgula sp.]